MPWSLMLTRYYPETGAVLYRDAQIWLRQVGVRLVPHLLRHDGSEVELELVSHALSDERDDRSAIERYRPVTPLDPGTYRLRLVAPPNPLKVHNLRDIIFRIRRGNEPKPPALPRVLRSSYFMRDRTPRDLDSPWAAEVEPSGPWKSARFELRIGNAMLVADFGRADVDPLDNLILAPARPDGVHTFQLGVPGYGLPDADYCTRSRVRFGALSAAGRFSGWTAWYAVNFPPREGGACPEAQPATATEPSPDAGHAAPAPETPSPAASPAELEPDLGPATKAHEPHRPHSRGTLVLLAVALGSLLLLLGWHLRSIER